MKSILIVIPGILAGMLFSCSQPEEKPKEVRWTKDQSVKLNQELALDEDLNIRMFLETRKSWKVEKTGSGLRYYIYEKGNGPKAESGMIAQVRFRISTLDGTECYKTEEGETHSFKIDRSEVETGVQEGIKLMHEGDKAMLIVPSHLGHGLVGDFDKIPPLSTLVIDLELVSLSAQK